MWIAEITTPDNLPHRTILEHRDRKAACRAMANYLFVLGRRPAGPHRAGEPALYTAAGDLFNAAATGPLSMLPVLRLGGLVYLVWQRETQVEG
jgi:hypothetical protein